MPTVIIITRHCPFCNFKFNERTLAGRHYTSVYQLCPDCGEKLNIGADGLADSWRMSIIRLLRVPMYLLSWVLCFLLVGFLARENPTFSPAKNDGGPLSVAILLALVFGWIPGLLANEFTAWIIAHGIYRRLQSGRPLPQICSRLGKFERATWRTYTECRDRIYRRLLVWVCPPLVSLLLLLSFMNMGRSGSKMASIILFVLLPGSIFAVIASRATARIVATVIYRRLERGRPLPRWARVIWEGPHPSFARR